MLSISSLFLRFRRKEMSEKRTKITFKKRCVWNRENSLGDKTIIVQVIQLEGPGELLLQISTGGHWESANELLEVNGAVLVDVKDIEHIVSEARWVTKREELLVNLLELVLGQVARRAVYNYNNPSKQHSSNPILNRQRKKKKKKDKDRATDPWGIPCTTAAAPSCQSLCTPWGQRAAQGSTCCSACPSQSTEKKKEEKELEFLFFSSVKPIMNRIVGMSFPLWELSKWKGVMNGVG